MVRVFPLLLVTSLTLMALAGCIGGDDTPPVDDEEKNVAEEARATEEYGAITGQVLDNSLEPVVGADVLLAMKDTQERTTKTDREGRYTFNEVTPGSYTIRVNAIGHSPGVKAIEVRANQVTDASLQLAKLSDVDLGLPYIVDRTFEGFLACGAGQAILPPGNPAYPDGINPRTSPCGTIDPNDEFLFEFTLEPGIQEIVIGMTWKPVGGISGTELNINMERDGCGATCPGNETYFEVSGPPDLVFQYKEEDLHEDLAFSAMQGTKPVQFRIFPAATQTPNVIYQQPYTVYLELYYNQLAEEDRNPIPDQ